MINTPKLMERMEERGISQKDIADALHCAQSTISLKINNKRPLYRCV